MIVMWPHPRRNDEWVFTLQLFRMAWEKGDYTVLVAGKFKRFK